MPVPHQLLISIVAWALQRALRWLVGVAVSLFVVFGVRQALAEDAR
jgi:hypothetical protein